MIGLDHVKKGKHRPTWRIIFVILFEPMTPLLKTLCQKALQVLRIPFSIISHAIIPLIAIPFFLPPS